MQKKTERKTSNPVSIEKSLWKEYKDMASGRGMSLSFVIRRLLKMWAEGLELEIKEN